MDALSLYELNALVRRSLEQCLPDAYWIQAELSDVRTNSTGQFTNSYAFTSMLHAFDIAFYFSHPQC